MTLDALRTATIKALQDRADAATSKAINMRPRGPSPNIPAITSDEYALQAVDALAEARAFLDAQKIINNEYRKLTQPEHVQAEAQDAVTAATNSRQRLYG